MQTIRIFISSPGDVVQERERAREVIESLRRRYARKFHLKPIFWEDLPLEPDMSFQEGIDIVLSERGVDIAVFILWARLGSPLRASIRKADDSIYRSGTEREYDLMIQARNQSGEKEGIRRPRMIVYTRRDDNSFDARLRGKSSAEKQELLRQKELVESFMKEVFKDAETGQNVGAYHPFDRPVTFSQRLRVHLQSILDEFAGDMDEVIWDIDKRGAPFLGLHAFQPEHADVFFGREEEILEARNAIGQQAREGCAFLLLSGASGSGKSSLARAGILPEILAHEIDDQTDVWRPLVLTPSELGADPIAGLVTRLADESILPELRGQSASLLELAADLTENPELTFRHTIRKAIEAASINQGSGVRILLVIDQLEELFTRDGIGKTRRKHFLAIIEAFARSGLIWVIATIRSDFYQEVQKEPALLRMKQGHGLLDVLPPGSDALQRVIEEPARLAGLSFEIRNGQSLSSRILKDAAPYTELLPLLEFVLTELYLHRTNRQLTFAAYETRGGVEGALASTAEETFLSLSAASQQSLGIVLQSLVTLGDEGNEGSMEKPVRQHAPQSFFAENENARQLIDTFVTARLFTTGDIGNNTEPTVTLAHESLLRVWPRAVKWREDDMDFLRTRSRIAARLKEGSPLLKGDPLLDTAKAFYATRAEAFTEKQRHYIQASLTAAEANERKAIKRRRFAFTALSILTLMAVAGTIFSVTKTIAARNSENKAAVAALAAGAANAKTVEKVREASRKAYGSAREAFDKRNDLATGLAYLAEALHYDSDNRLAREEAANWLFSLPSVCPAPIAEFSHSDDITMAVFSPDGTRVVTASRDKTARIWDALTGKPIGIPLLHHDVVSSAAFSPDGTRVVTASEDNTAQIWDALSGKPIGEPLRNQGFVICVDFGPDGVRVITQSRDHTARIWDLLAGKPIGEPLRHDDVLISATFSPDRSRVLTAGGVNAQIWDATSGKPIGDPLRHGDEVDSAIFSPDGARIVTTTTNDDDTALTNLATARIWDAVTGKLIGEPLSHEYPSLTAAFSPDGVRVITVNFDTLRIWNAVSGKFIGALPNEVPILNAAFSPDGMRIVAVNRDKTVQVWDSISGHTIGEVLRHEHEVQSAAFSPDGAHIVTISDDYTARMWEAVSGKRLDTPLRHDNFVTNAVFSPDGTRIVTASFDKTARIWDAVSGRTVGEPLRHDELVNCASFSPDGARIVTASDDDTARIWDAVSGKPIGEPLRHKDYVSTAAFSSDGTRVLTVSGDNAAWIWDTSSGQPIGEPFRHEDSVNSAAFSPDGTRIVTASFDKTARIWDATSFKAIGEPLRHEDSVNSAIFSPDGARVVTTSDKEGARIWDAASGKPIGQPIRHNHEGSVDFASFSPDGSRIITEGDDKSAQLWDAVSGKPIGTPLRHEEGVRCASFSPDGTRVVTASYDRTARIWDAFSGAPIGPSLRHNGKVRSAAFSPDGQRVVTASDDFTARIWNIAPRNLDHPQLLNMLTTVAGIEVSAPGHVAEIPLYRRVELRKALLDFSQSSAFEQKFIRWIFASPAASTLSPSSTLTITELVESETDWCFSHPKANPKIIVDAYLLHPSHPLIHFGLAWTEKNELRKKFLIDYGLKHLPKDPRILAKAANYLRQLADPKHAVEVADKVLNLEPDNFDALQIKAWANGQAH